MKTMFLGFVSENRMKIHGVIKNLSFSTCSKTGYDVETILNR
jgi:hypothetical protein